MSRIGKKSIPVPKGVKVSVDGPLVVVEGPKGRLERRMHAAVAVKVDPSGIVVERRGNDRTARSMHGLTRTIVSNMVSGAAEPFKKSLEITGVGYRAEMKGKNLQLQVGLSHEVLHPIPSSVDCQVEKQTLVHLTSMDKELLGQIASQLRAYRPCEPYKGKGVKYVGERVLRKEGKTGAS